MVAFVALVPVPLGPGWLPSPPLQNAAVGVWAAGAGVVVPFEAKGQGCDEDPEPAELLAAWVDGEVALAAGVFAAKAPPAASPMAAAVIAPAAIAPSTHFGMCT